MGASGSGKTTLMNLLGCLDHPTSGRYWFDNEEISGYSADKRANLRNRKIGFVFQSFNLLPRTNALDQVVMPLTYSARKIHDREEFERGSSLLESVGLADRMHHEPSQMSGGQQQRVAIARSLVNRPQLLLADEPTGNLDSRTSEEILRMFQELNAAGLTIIIVTHDANVAAHASRIIHMRDGKIEGDNGAVPAGPGGAHGRAPSSHAPNPGSNGGSANGGQRTGAAPRRSLNLRWLESAPTRPPHRWRPTKSTQPTPWISKLRPPPSPRSPSRERPPRKKRATARAGPRCRCTSCRAL